MSERSNTFSFQNNHKDSRNMQNTGPWVSNNRWTQSSDQAFDHSHFDIRLHNASPQNRTNSIAMKTTTSITNSSTSALPVPTYSQGLSKPVKSETGMADNFNRNQNKHFTESIENRCPQPIMTEHWSQEHNILPPQTFAMGPSGSASGSQFSSFGNIPQQSGSTSSQNHIKQTNSKETMWIPSHGQAQPQQKMFSGPPPCLPPLTRLPPPQFPPVFNPLAPPPPLPGFPPPSLPQPFGGQPPPPFPRPLDNSSFNYIPVSGAPFNANSAYAPATAPNWTEKINGQQLLQHMTGNTGTNMTNKETSQQNTNISLSEPGAQADLNQWLKKIKKFGDHMVNHGCTDSGRNHQLEKLKNIKESDRINFPDAQNKLCSLLHALAAVQGALQQLQEDHEMASSDAWHQSVTQIQELKEKYLATKQLLNYEQLKTLQKKLEARRKKRAQIKLQKLREKDKKQEMLFEHAKKHAALDLWQDQILQKDLRQKQIKEMKETADRTLAKVRREIREATKMLDTLKSLQKLRDIRKDTAEKRGQTFPPSIAEHFSSKMTDLTQLLSEQIQAFEKEEATLKIILETEQEEARVKKEQEKQQKEKQQKQDDAQSLSLSLFGPEVVRSYGDPMLPFDQFYQQARCSLQAFISVRHMWDIFLVPEGTQGGSRIPDGWVEPELPTSSVWASVIQANSTTN